MSLHVYTDTGHVLIHLYTEDECRSFYQAVLFVTLSLRYYDNAIAYLSHCFAPA